MKSNDFVIKFLIDKLMEIFCFIGRAIMFLLVNLNRFISPMDKLLTIKSDFLERKWIDNVWVIRTFCSMECIFWGVWNENQTCFYWNFKDPFLWSVTNFMDYLKAFCSSSLPNFIQYLTIFYSLSKYSSHSTFHLPKPQSNLS